MAAEVDVVKLLAYYDVRGVGDAKLRAMFRCAAEDLENARASEEYKDAYAAEISAFETMRAEIDDSWDALEKSALGNLVEAAAASSDPRFLLGAAVSANKANRRNLASAPASAKPVIDVTPPQGQATTVIRMRTRFLEELQDAKSARRIAEREMEISVTNQSNLKEDMSPQEVKSLLQRALGVDVSNEDQIMRAGNTEEMDFSQMTTSQFIKQVR